MIPINLLRLSGKTSLLTRATADQIIDGIDGLQDAASTSIVVDLSGIIAITPSFLDQLVGGLKGLAAARAIRPLRVRLLEMPTHASEKFAAVGRSHGLFLREESPRDWLLEEPDSDSHETHR